ncbi:RanGTP-binding protein-domain-containing protein [Globomyces pollinis-pini]|nr:RanGTP-binding protein-domain-containing protein [Globomyces pollinis-pini]
MENFINSIATTSAVFLGKACWSYAATTALKRITKYHQNQLIVDSSTVPIHTENANYSDQLSNLLKKLDVLLTIVNPILDSLELKLKQGHLNYIPVLSLSNQIKDRMVNLHPTNDSIYLTTLQDIIREINDLIPILTLAIQSNDLLAINATNTSSPISNQLLLKSSYYLTRLQKKSNTPGPQTSMEFHLNIKLYTLFQSSINKSNKIDWLWKEEFVYGHVTIDKIETDFGFQMKIIENLDDGRYHEENEDARVTVIPIENIIKLYYTTSGDLLNISDYQLPVLVAKLNNGNDDEWIALELYTTETDEDDGDADLVELDDDRTDLVQHQVHPDLPTPSESQTSHSTQLTNLNVLEYMLKLCILETMEQQSHLDVNNQILLKYFGQDSDVSDAKPKTEFELPVTKIEYDYDFSVKGFLSYLKEYTVLWTSWT